MRFREREWGRENRFEAIDYQFRIKVYRKKMHPMNIKNYQMVNFSKPELERWIQRDLGCILPEAVDHGIIQSIILSFVQNTPGSLDGMKNALVGFLQDQTDQFCQELLYFSNSQLNMHDYDKYVKYIT